MPEAENLVWKGYAVHDTAKWNQPELIDFEPKKMEDYDVDIKIEYCGICGSDLHTITGGWGANVMLPVIPGHEITGHVVRIGAAVSEFKVGQRVGVGAQVCSCFKCAPCNTDNENYCQERVDTYNAKYCNGDTAWGGYATAIRAHERFVFPIPDGMPLDHAAPFFCAGLTVFSPMVRNGLGPGKRLGVVGIGGLGHFAIQFGKALGAEVVVFSHSNSKEKDARELGAGHFVTTDDENFADEWKLKLDLIICTADVSKGIPLKKLLTTLVVNGRFIMVALPDDQLPPINSFELANNGVLLGGSRIGNKKEVIEMFKIAVENNVKSMIEVVPMKDVSKALEAVADNKARYRVVLKNDIA